MKKFAVLAVLAAASAAACAQTSSVTLFGIVDVAAKQIKNGDTSQKQLGTDGLSSSRLGVRGVEDLGGGLSAGFWLESAVSADNGTSNATRFWHRRATASLIGKFGELRAGRELTPSFTGFADFDPFNTNGVADSGKFANTSTFLAKGLNAATMVRADNMISYYLPGNLGGLYGSVSVAAGEAKDPSGNKYVGARLGYAAGPVNVSVAMGSTDAAIATTTYATTVSATKGVTSTTTLSGADKYKSAALGASYDAKVVKVLGYVQKLSFGDAKISNYDIGALIPVGAGVVRFGYVNSKGSGTTFVEGTDATQIAVGYIHNLSKRTSLYTTYASVKNKGTATYSVGSIGGYTIAAGDKSTGFEFGVKHAF